MYTFTYERPASAADAAKRLADAAGRADADAFYAHYADGRSPEVSTSQPSPGQFAVAYEDLAARGVPVRITA